MVNSSSIRFPLPIVAHLDFDLPEVDVFTELLNGEVEEDNFTEVAYEGQEKETI